GDVIPFVTSGLNAPLAITVDTNGLLYVANSGDNTIVGVRANGKAFRIAGAPGTTGSADGLDTNVQFSSPTGIAVDANTNLYIADGDNNTIRLGVPFVPAQTD